MKKLITFFGVEIERLIWIFALGLLVIVSFVALLLNEITVAETLSIFSVAIGFGYIGSIIKKTKTETITSKLLTEENNIQAGLDPSFDQLNQLIKNVSLFNGVMQKNNKKQIID